MLNVKNIQINIIQVQQFLTDVSATRGQDGLDDGFEEAAKNARVFGERIVATRALAGRLGAVKVNEAIDEVEKAFKPYYEIGQKMAKTYVAEGPPGGNRMMPEFDERSEKLASSMEALISISEELSKHGQGEITRETGLASSQLQKLSSLLYSLGGISVLIAGLAIAMIRYGVVKPLAEMVTAVSSVAEGDLETTVPGLTRSDEIGVLARALETFKANLQRQREQDRQLNQIREAAEKDAVQSLLEMCESLENEVTSTVVEVLQDSKQAVEGGERAVADGRVIASEAIAVAAAAEQASQNVNSISAETEQLSATGREIARRAAQSADASQKAVREVDLAGSTITALSSSAEQIGIVVSLIAEVAAQTNLLALNATIEAARAGEMGKGFAVVASEVKALARKTGDAASDISERIKQICSVTGESVDALTRIGAAVREINQVSSGMALAAEQQESTLQEVARSLSEASTGVSSVAASVSAISARAEGVQGRSQAVATAVANTDDRIGNLRANLIVTLRRSAAGNRRSGIRKKVNLPGSVTFEQAVLRGTVVDLSQRGLLFKAASSDAAVAEGSAIAIAIDTIGTIQGSVIAKSSAGMHMQFAEIQGEIGQRLDTVLAKAMVAA
jgi:methyl-accepting chemotaxis protein